MDIFGFQLQGSTAAQFSNESGVMPLSLCRQGMTLCVNFSSEIYHACPLKSLYSSARVNGFVAQLEEGGEDCRPVEKH